jgi:Domain of unknown function (DUF1848)
MRTPKGDSMVISASRRTDLPAFYAEWFINRVRAEYCCVPNPFNPAQVSRISLAPRDVDAIVFWTRNPEPLMPHLAELDARGYQYYFLYTFLDYPTLLDPGMPPLDARVATFRRLANVVSAERVLWRYDPIVLSTKTPPAFHVDAYGRIASHLQGATTRSIISFVDIYRKLGKRLRRLEEQGCRVEEPTGEDLAEIVPPMVETAAANGMQLQSCAEKLDLARFGVLPGKCIDDAHIESALGAKVDGRKDPSQRGACGCVASRDIGCYDTCLHGCAYCYATSSLERAKANHAAHDPEGPQLV